MLNYQRVKSLKPPFHRGDFTASHAMPCHAMPCHAMPCHAMPCHAMPCHASHASLSQPALARKALPGSNSASGDPSWIYSGENMGKYNASMYLYIYIEMNRDDFIKLAHFLDYPRLSKMLENVEMATKSSRNLRGSCRTINGQKLQIHESVKNRI